MSGTINSKWTLAEFSTRVTSRKQRRPDLHCHQFYFLSRACVIVVPATNIC